MKEEGLESKIKEEKDKKKQNQKNVTALTAGSRAIVTQMITFYTRAPVKLFRPSRFDYLFIARAINPSLSKPWNIFTHSSPALLAHAIKKYGWTFIPKQVLPPFIANSLVGTVLYGSYIISLEKFYDSSSKDSTPTFSQIFPAGCIAGICQSIIAAPLDAISLRFSVDKLINPNHESLWNYGFRSLKQIGFAKFFAGSSICLLKDSLGFGAFFATFEISKIYFYNNLLYFFNSHNIINNNKDEKNFKKNSEKIQPIYSISILLSGFIAATVLQIIEFPFSKIQRIHINRLELIDLQKEFQQANNGNSNYKNNFLNKLKSLFIWPRLYTNAYAATLSTIWIKSQANLNGVFSYLYKGFLKNSLTAVPASSVGIIVFEVLRGYMDTSVD